MKVSKMALLLDTNVISELTRHIPEPRVVSLVRDAADGCLSVITLHELKFGILRLPHGAKQAALLAKADRLLQVFEGAILPVDQGIAEAASQMRAQQDKAGRRLVLVDALIAATALVHSLTLATRNTKDFQGLGVSIIDPWRA
jgi:toxin FitB